MTRHSKSLITLYEESEDIPQRIDIIPVERKYGIELFLNYLSTELVLPLKYLSITQLLLVKLDLMFSRAMFEPKYST